MKLKNLWLLGSAVFMMACNEHQLSAEFPESSSSAAPSPFGTMIDRAGNVYKTVKMDDQEWATENLRLDEKNTGIVCRDSVGGKCAHALYNHETAKTVCPSGDGWRLPSDADWKKLVVKAGKQYNAECLSQAVPAAALQSDAYRRFPGDTSLGTCIFAAGQALKARTGWKATEAGDDLLSFDGLPEGYRDISEEFLQVGNYAYFWSSDVIDHPLYDDEKNASASWYLTKSKAMVHAANYNDAWLSVRCMRDLK